MIMAARLRSFILALAVLAGALSLGAGAANAEWLRAESPNFIVYSESGEDRLRAQLGELEDFRQLLRQLTGTADPPEQTRLSVYMIRGIADLRQIWPGASAAIGGFYNATPEGVLAVVDAESGRGWTGRNETLFHEYAHHFMLQHFPGVYPPWYVEGFAEYVATARFDGDTIEYGRTNAARASWIADRSGWIPMEHLLFSSTEAVEGRPMAQYYAQSWLLLHYLLRDPVRMRQLNRYLVAVGGGQAPRAAFQEAFGTTATAMQRQLMVYAGRDMSFTRVRRASGPRPPAIAVAQMPRSADDLLLLDASMTNGAELGEAFVRRVRRAAGDSPDPFAKRVLARAEALHGDGAAAERLLNELLATSPNDAGLLYLMGMRHLRAGRADEAGRAAHFRTAQRWFGRAHRADASHYPTLYRYAESLSHDPAVLLTDNTTNILLLAQQIAPQAHALRLSAANLLLRRERWAEAEAMVAPLAAHPHAGAIVRSARAMLAKARARDKSGLPGVFDIPREDSD